MYAVPEFPSADFDRWLTTEPEAQGEPDADEYADDPCEPEAWEDY
jgi:hypothetical protein